MSDTEEPVPEPPDGQHIFHNQRVTLLALKWKDLVKNNQHGEAMDVLEEIIIESTNMFERLAQGSGFHHTVDLPTLVQAAREKMVRWLAAWDSTKKSKNGLFSYLSMCAKHAFLSEISKVNQHRKRFHVTGDTLEKFYGTEDHESTKNDGAIEAKRHVKQITARWGDPVMLGAVRMVIDSMIEERPQDRQAVIRTVSYAYGLSPEMAKFLYNWGLFALRDAMYEKNSARYTLQDIIRHKETHSHLVDLIDIIGFETFKKVVALLGGTRLKIPTQPLLARWHEEYLIKCEIEEEGLDPDSVARVAKRHGKSEKAASEIFETMTHELSPERSGEHYVYDDGDTA